MRHRLRSLIDKLLHGAPQKTGPTGSKGAARPTGALEGHGLADTDISHVHVAYEPSMDGDPDPGEVVWTWVPFEEDLTQGKDRPVVVIGRTGAYLAGVALTSKAGHPDDHVAVGTGPWDRQGRPSYAKLDRVLRIDPVHVRREGAILDVRRFEQLIQALREHG